MNQIAEHNVKRQHKNAVKRKNLAAKKLKADQEGKRFANVYMLAGLKSGKSISASTLFVYFDSMLTHWFEHKGTKSKQRSKQSNARKPTKRTIDDKEGSHQDPLFFHGLFIFSSTSSTNPLQCILRTSWSVHGLLSKPEKTQSGKYFRFVHVESFSDWYFDSASSM